LTAREHVHEALLAVKKAALRALRVENMDTGPLPGLVVFAGTSAGSQIDDRTFY
jgi:hypothetical protein